MQQLSPASTPDATRARRTKHGRHVVIVGEPPADWKPADPGDVPPDGIVESEALASGLTLAQAIAECRAFNADSMRHGSDLWAVILFRPKGPKGGVK